MCFITFFTLSLVLHVIPETLILNHFVQMLYLIIHVAVMKDKYQVFIKLQFLVVWGQNFNQTLGDVVQLTVT
jgi:hypothetical protein